MPLYIFLNEEDLPIQHQNRKTTGNATPFLKTMSLISSCLSPEQKCKQPALLGFNPLS